MRFISGFEIDFQIITKGEKLNVNHEDLFSQILLSYSAKTGRAEHLDSSKGSFV